MILIKVRKNISMCRVKWKTNIKVILLKLSNSQDGFGGKSSLGGLFLIIPAFILSCFLHPSLNGNLISDISWTFSAYLESCALLPQLYLFNQIAASSGGVFDLVISHTVFALGMARLVETVSQSNLI